MQQFESNKQKKKFTPHLFWWESLEVLCFLPDFQVQFWLEKWISFGLNIHLPYEFISVQ